jgi:AraC-like DNA-binding protein
MEAWNVEGCDKALAFCVLRNACGLPYPDNLLTIPDIPLQPQQSMSIESSPGATPRPLPLGHVRIDGVVRLGPLMSLPALLREFGCDPDPLMKGIGIGPNQFEDPDARVSYVAAAEMLVRCAEATRCEHLGLLVGQRASASSLGVAGFILQTAPDVGTALRDLVAHLDMHDDGGVPFVATEGDFSLLGYAIHQPDVERAAGQIYDLSMAVACNILRGLCGANWNPTGVLLSRRRPPDVKPYGRHFKAPVRFEADQSAIVFSRRWLAHPLRGADPFLRRHLKKAAIDERMHRDLGLVGDLRRVLRAGMVTRAYSVAEAGRQLGLHERTLNRQLRANGTTFRRELDTVRYATARELLASSSMALDNIAAALDYADASAFSRAFKRWSGSTPAQWRRGNRQA